jgi:hypothetical protein
MFLALFNEEEPYLAAGGPDMSLDSRTQNPRGLFYASAGFAQRTGPTDPVLFTLC